MITKEQQEIRDKYYSTTQLKQERKKKWTSASIKKFLEEPDEIEKNPHNNKKMPGVFWKKDRVHEAEDSEAWQDWYERTLNQRQRAREKVLEFQKQTLQYRREMRSQ